MARMNHKHRKDDLSPTQDNAIMVPRADVVVEMVAEGIPLRDIATKLDVTVGTVRRDFHTAMQRTITHTAINVDAYREKQQAEIDYIKGILSPHVAEGKVSYIDRYFQAMRIEADLLGLNAPVKVAQTDKDGNDRYASHDFDAAFAALADALAASRAPRTDDAPGGSGPGGAPAVHVEGMGTAEPVAAEWSVADVADISGQRLRQVENPSRDGPSVD